MVLIYPCKQIYVTFRGDICTKLCGVTLNLRVKMTNFAFTPKVTTAGRFFSKGSSLLSIYLCLQGARVNEERPQ